MQFLNANYGQKFRKLSHVIDDVIGDGTSRKKNDKRDDNCLLCIQAFIDKSWLIGQKFLVTLNIMRESEEPTGSTNPSNLTTISTTTTSKPMSTKSMMPPTTKDPDNEVGSDKIRDSITKPINNSNAYILFQ